MLRAETLAVRLQSDELFELRDQRLVAAQRELGVVQQLASAETLLFELRRLCLCHMLAREIRQRRPSPQLECSRQALGGIRSVAGRERLLSFRDEAPKPHQVELVRLQQEPVGRSVGFDSPAAEDLA
jgi:hypothetical protein